MAEGIAPSRQRSQFWTWFVFFLIAPPLAQVLGRWLPVPIASGASFFVVFAIAGNVVARRLDSDRPGLLRIIGASALGACVLILFRYVLP